MPRKILIMGLPRSGKTMLANALAPLLCAVHFNAADAYGEAGENPEITPEGQIRHARRVGWLCDQVIKAGHYAIADFVCPTPEARAAFGDAFTVYLKIREPPLYAKTQAMFIPPSEVDYEIREQNAGFHAQKIAERLVAHSNGFDWRKPTALVVSHFQPFSDRHRAIVLEAIARVGQACVAVCGAEDVDAKNLFGFMTLRDRIKIMLADQFDEIAIIGLPNLSTIVLGRDADLSVEHVGLPAALQAVFADNTRAPHIAEIVNADKTSVAA